MNHPAIALLLLPVPLLLAPVLLLLAIYPRHIHPSMPRFALHVLLTIIGLNIALPVVLHLLGLPIHRLSQQIAMGSIALLALPVAAYRSVRTPLHLLFSNTDRLMLFALLALLPLLLPWSHLTGIDTYKWQDFASAVVVGQRIPWLSHPLGFLGLAPRSYPAAFPLLLASCQLPGQGAVLPGYAIASLLVGTTALLTAYQLGRRLFPAREHAIMMAVVYAFSPVVLRYTHWATGRGLFLALYPLMLTTSLRTVPRTIPLLIAQGALLLTCHKVALVAVPLTLIGALTRLYTPLPAPTRRSTMILAAISVGLLVIACALVPGLVGIATIPRLAVTRYHWLLPFALIGFAMRPAVAGAPQWRALLPALLLAPILAFDPSMYGAMIVTPHIAAFATAAVLWLSTTQQRPTLVRLAIALSMAGAIATVAHRAQSATPPHLRALAASINDQAAGPIVLHGARRRHAQAYVLAAPGCWDATTVELRGVSNPLAAGLTRSERIQRLRWLIRTEGTIEWVPADAQHIWISENGVPAPPKGAAVLATDGPFTAYIRPES